MHVLWKTNFYRKPNTYITIPAYAYCITSVNERSERHFLISLIAFRLSFFFAPIYLKWYHCLLMKMILIRRDRPVEWVAFLLKTKAAIETPTWCLDTQIFFFEQSYNAFFVLGQVCQSISPCLLIPVWIKRNAIGCLACQFIQYCGTSTHYPLWWKWQANRKGGLGGPKKIKKRTKIM